MRRPCRTASGIITANRALVFLVLAVFCSCDNGPDKVAGGAQDFPNSLEAAGALTLRALESETDWKLLEQAPQSVLHVDPESLLLRSGAASKVPQPLNKTSIAAFGMRSMADTGMVADFRDTTFWNLEDSASGSVWRYHLVDNPFLVLRDTFQVLYDATALDSVDGNETILLQRGRMALPPLGFQYTYRLENTDSTGAMDQRKLSLEYTGFDAVTHRISLEDQAGKDGSLDSADDNPALSLEVYHHVSGDTLVYDSWRDADGIGTPWSQLGILPDEYVQLRISKGDSAGPGLLRQQIEQRLFVRPANASYVRQLEWSKHHIGGMIERIKAIGSGSDSLIAPEGQARVSISRSLPAPDSLAGLTLEFQLSVPKEPHLYSSYAWSSLSIACDLRSGVFDSLSLFLARTEASEEPTLVGNFTLNEGGTATMTGFAGKSLDVSYRTPDGMVYRAEWARDGKLLNRERE